MIEVKAYSGLLRNHRELAGELGVDIKGLARVERERALLAAAWKAWGEETPAHLNGQFAFALYDNETGELFCARDPFGAEVFFYYRTADGGLLYGTEIGDLLGQPGFVRRLNRGMVQFYLGFTYVPGEETLFEGVYKLEPGGWLRFRTMGAEEGGESDAPAAPCLELGRYWELVFQPDDSKTLDEWADEVEAALEAGLADMMDEGERPDSFLSGGVDSSYILAKSRARRGFCVAYEDQAASEEADARATAEHLGRDFEAVFVSPEDFFGAVDEFLLAYEQPSADVAGLSLFAACKKVAGVSGLCLSGEGADEFFAGYGVYGRAERYRLPGATYFGSTYIMSPAEQRRYLKRYCSERSERAFVRERCPRWRCPDTLSWMLYTDMRTYFEGSILFNSARIARGTGLDIRMPFVDRRMLEVACRMPSSFKTDKAGNKLALRRAASRVLPHEVAYRKKLGFPVPVRRWLAEPAAATELRRAFESEAAGEFFKTDEIGALLDAFLGQKPRVAHPVWFPRHRALLWRHVWTIYVFIRWYELFFGKDAERSGGQVQ